MTRDKVKYQRTTLNPNQIQLLDLVYKYRFVSRQLLAESIGINPQNGMHKRLEVLVKLGYLDIRFDKRFKLLGMPIAYYLTPLGLRALRTAPGHVFISDTMIKNAYKDKTVGQTFIDHTLEVYRLSNLMKSRYPGMKIFGRRDMSQYNYFPTMLPDLFLSVPTDEPAKPRRYFFDLVSDNTPRIALDKRIANYCEFFGDGGWDATDSPLPTLLIISEWGPAEKRIQRTISTQLSRLNEEDLTVLTTTSQAIKGINSLSSIWTSLEDTEQLLELSGL